MKHLFPLLFLLFFYVYSWGQDFVKQDSLQRYHEDQEKLFHFVKNTQKGPLLTIDSLVAVDSLKVLPSSYHLFLESLRWKKKYPIEDFLKIREYVRKSAHNRLFIAIDSVTAVDQLKINPCAYRDLNSNLQDCNKVTIYNENITLLKQYIVQDKKRNGHLQ